MKNYWSCSKFADWLRGTAKPASGTCEAWSAWEKQAKQKSLRYWLAEEGLDYLQNIVYAPMTFTNAIRRYISNRFVVKTHALTSSTLKRGQWHELDTRLLYAAFDELINFVETDLAYTNYICSSAEDRKKFYMPWHRKFFRLGFWRCPEAGLNYLNWASQLKNDDEWLDKNDSEFGRPTQQALAAQEILMLYNWWKNGRPNRPDPHDASGLTTYSDENAKTAKKSGEDSWCQIFSNEKTDEEREHQRAIFELNSKIEKEQDDEDTDMFIRLIKIRQFLWA